MDFRSFLIITTTGVRIGALAVKHPLIGMNMQLSKGEQKGGKMFNKKKNFNLKK
jgi:hypothetical protein